VPSSSQLRVRAAGRLELLNAFVTLEEGNIAIQSGGVFYCRNSIVYSNGSNNSDSNGPRILMETENVDIDGLVITSERGNFQSIAFFRPPQPGVKNFKPIHCLLGVQFNNATNGTEFSIDARGNGEYVTFSQFGVVDRTVFVESLDGALLSARSKDLSPYMSWALLQFINWKINIRDADGPTTAFLYLKDFYNGADRRYVYASLAHENQKEYRESIPASGEVDLRLTVALSDRNLQIDPSPLIELDPPLDDRRPIFGWLRKYGHFQAAVTINSLISGVQGYLLVRNRAISLSQPDADAITGVSITVHDTPVDWNGLQWSITIEVDGPTANQAWQWVHSQQTKNSPLAGGLDGMQLHEMWPSVAQTDSGIYFDNASQTTFRRGVRVITATGDPLQGVTSMEADDENVYNPPTSVVLTIRNIIPGSELVLKIGTFILFKVDPTGNTAAYGYVYPGFDQLVDVFINQEGYEFFVNKGIVLGLTNQSLRAEQSTK